ncbi:hypothetical protein P8C59_006081 [Phyllachora maydis]|uniref:glutaminase n=1 Tax=Phyllachora maydis TaxID=1825666 RepID=A0AAD9I6Z3_9PEZI|nr:hypothetical protein P8C59_006081 [Phyllachora maydis]
MTHTIQGSAGGVGAAAISVMVVIVGVLALQGGVVEHLALLHRAAAQLAQADTPDEHVLFDFIQVRSEEQLSRCDALIIPGGESTTMAIVSSRLGLLEPLRKFVKSDRKPVWGTCAGLVMLAESASATKQGGQELVGGLGVKVLRNRYGTQVESFVADIPLPFLGNSQATQDDERSALVPFRGVFIRAPVVEEVLTPAEENMDGVQVLGVYKKSDSADPRVGDIVAVRQRNAFGTSFHPELTNDTRIHEWWLRQVLDEVRKRQTTSS